MVKKNLFLKILFSAAFLLCLLLPPVPVFAAGIRETANDSSNYITLMPDVSFQMTSAEFWLGKINNPNEVILAPAQIEAMNGQAFENLVWLNNLNEWEESITKDQLTDSINARFPNRELFINNLMITPGYFNNLRENMNLGGISDTVTVRYGIIVNRTNIRGYPTFDIITDIPGDVAYDEFQVTAAFIGEPVIVLHESLDRRFFYCVTRYCYGWIDKNDTALSRTKTEWIDAQNYETFLIVTGNSIKLDENPFYPEISNMEFFMGTKLNLIPASDHPESLFTRRVYGNYIVKIPVRDMDGYLNQAYLPVPVSKDVHVGYMPYTYRNVFNQLFKMHGDRYGWGGMMRARDCSAMTQELYRCFGIYLPRNSGWQANYIGRSIDMSALSAEEKNVILLEQVKPGALLRFPGHIMVYLGNHNGKHYVMSAVDSFAIFDETENAYIRVQTRTVIINTLDTKRMTGFTWLEALTNVMALDIITPGD